MPTISEPISDGADDIWTLDATINGAPANQANASGVSLTAGRQYYNAATFYQHRLWGIGLRFRALSVDQGVTINSATLTTERTVLAGTPGLKIYGDDVDDAALWAASGQLPREITKTTASASPNTGAGTQTHDVTAIIQEIVNRGGWASGNDMRLAVLNTQAFPTPGYGTGSNDNDRWIIASLEHPTLAAPSLEIDYSVAAAIVTPRGFMVNLGRGMGM